MIKHFSTDTVEPAKRLDFWNALCAQTYSGLCIDSHQTQDFHATMKRWELDCLTMIHPVSDGARVQRIMHHWRTDTDRIVLNVQHWGKCRHSHLGVDSELGVGDMVLCSTGAHYRTDISDQNAMLVVEMPRAILAGRIPHLDSVVARRIAGGRPGTKLLHDFLVSLWQQGERGELVDQWQKEVVQIFVDLLALVVNHDGENSEGGKGKLRQRLLALVEARLRDPELGTASIARELQVSMRTVQHVFAAMGATPSAYILDRRLQMAADGLLAHPGRSITDIAYDVGFNESAYFSRCFRRKFSLSPRSFRAANDVPNFQ